MAAATGVPRAEDFAGLSADSIFGTAAGGTAAGTDPITTDLADAGAAEPGPADGDPSSHGIAVSIDAATDGARSAATAPMSLEAIAEQLHRLAATADDPMPLELVAAVLLLAAEDPEAIENLPIAGETRSQLMSDEVETREAFAAFARAVRTRMDDGEPLRDVLVAELGDLSARLRNEPDLRIGDAEICSAIRAFGDVDVLPHRLPARVDREVLVYVPLEGLEWIEDRAAGRHRWQVRHRVELHQRSDGLVIDPGSWTILDHALPVPTRDTYFWVRYTIPGRDLASGRYALKVRVEEPSTGRQAERTIELDLLPERLVARE